MAKPFSEPIQSNKGCVPSGKGTGRGFSYDKAKGGNAVNAKARIGMLLLAAFLLLACTPQNDTAMALSATILDGEHYTVEVGSVSVEPGETAAFLVQTDPGFLVASTDYRGDYRITQAHGLNKVELTNVQYPTRVHLKLTQYAVTIEYLANGGEGISSVGNAVKRSYDITEHIRPNVSIGTDLFARDGYTLIGWNTEPDGSGTRVGLGSRMTVDGSATLYAEWAKWTDAERFAYRAEDGKAILTGYTGTEETLVVPETLDGYPVSGIDAFAMKDCSAKTVILPKSIERIERNAFSGAAFTELHLFDNIVFVTDESFASCPNLSTVYISAIEDPYGYSFRRESVYVDKLDRLITTQGQDRLIFYGGCSVWYNLDGDMAKRAFGDRYTVLNMGVNGIMGSLFQMELLRCFMTDRDILVHTPEIASRQQLLLNTGLISHDDKLWAALEYNYDLVSLVDIRLFDNTFFESFRHYLDRKKPGGKYTDVYRDSKGRTYLDEIGSVPFERDEKLEKLTDTVELLPGNLSDLSRLQEEYAGFTAKGIPIYVTYAAINIDQVPEEQRGNVAIMGERFTEAFFAMDGVTVFGNIRDFLYHDNDCYDTVYHLQTRPARHCTEVWIRELTDALLGDGRWEVQR